MRKFSWYLLLILSILLEKTSIARSEQLINYTVKDGLCGNNVYHIYSDSKGYLWIGTSLGVSRFDGHEFVNFSVLDGLPDNDVFISAEDGQGRIWFGTYKSDLSYVQDDSVHRYQFNEELGKMIPNKTVKLGFYFGESGEIMLADRSYSLIRIGNTGETKIIGGYECSIFDFGNQVLVAQDKKYMFSSPFRKEQGFRLYDALDGFKVVDSNFVKFSENSAKGSHYCIKTGSESYLLIKGEFIWHIEKDTSYYLESRFISDCIFMDQGGQVWIGTHNNGVFVFSDTRLTDTIGHFLDGQTVSHVTKDFEGGIWISTLGHGIYHLPNIDYAQLSGTGLPEGNITELIRGPENSMFAQYDNGDIWYGIDNNWQLLAALHDLSKREPRVIFYDEKTKTLFIKADRVYPARNLPFEIKLLKFRDEVNPASYLFRVSRYRNEIIEIRGRGIYKGGEKDRIVYNEELFNAGISGVTEYNDTLWIGSLEGLYYMAGRSVYASNHPLIEDKHVLQIIYRNNERIIVTENHGILIEKEKTREWINNAQSLPNGITRCKLDENGVLWIGSQNGLYYLDMNRLDRVKKLSAQQGFWNQKVNDLLTVNGAVYIAEERGLIKLKNSVISGSDIRPPRNYATIQTVNGNLWTKEFGTVFEHDQNNIEIKMTSVGFTNQEDRVFEWKFKDSKKDWQKSKSDLLTFSELSPKKYILLIRSGNVPGIWSETSKLSFTIKPAFWQSTLFLVVSIIAFIGIIFGMFYLRLKSLDRRARKNLALSKEKSDLEIRALRAQMNPHFVFNSLTSIQYLINLKKNDEAEFYLNKFSRLLRLIVDRAGYTENTLLSELDLLRIFVDLENLRYEDKFDFVVEIDDEIDIERALIPGIILQPFIENSIEHGLAKKDEKGRLYLGIRKVRDSIEIVIEDDGIGREKSAELRIISGNIGQSVGVNNVKRRIELLQKGNLEHLYSFEIKDLYNEKGDAGGTRVNIIIPYKLNEA